MAYTVDGLSYDKRKKITIQNANVDSDLTDFPCYIDITSDTDIGAVSNADGFDHRFTASDGTTLLKYERESFSITGGSATGHYWVKVPTVSSSGGTDIYLYYRSTDTADGADPTNVWDANFKGVYHLNQDTKWLDSTSNNSDLTEVGTVGISTSGKIGNCANFGGGAIYNEYNVFDFGTGDFSLSGWFKATSVATSIQYLISQFLNTGTPYNGYYIRMQEDDIKFTAVDDGGTPYPDGVIATGVLSADTWYYVAASRSSTSGILYLNASKYTGTVDSGTVSTSGINLILGRGGATSYPLTGMLDEVRLSSDVRSDAWFKFEYYNINEADNELTWGAEETSGATSAIKTINGLAKASVKTVNGLATASVKTWGGLS